MFCNTMFCVICDNLEKLHVSWEYSWFLSDEDISTLFCGITLIIDLQFTSHCLRGEYTGQKQPEF